MPAGRPQGRGQETATEGGRGDSPSRPPRVLSSRAAGRSSERSPSSTDTHRDAAAAHARTRVQTESPAAGATYLTGLKAQVGLSR